MGQQGWIDDVDLWLYFLDSRNSTAHTYNAHEALRVFKATEKFAIECRDLLNNFKTEILK